jgi:hypothetical protein
MKTVLLALALLSPAQDKGDLKTALKDVDVAARWIYDDLDAGYAEARKTGKPMLVVLRCVPCKGFKDIDKQTRTEETELAALFDKFVCVRIVQMWGADLSVFQFHDQLNWAVFFMNADRTIYGRFGTKDLKPGAMLDADKASTVAGLRKACEGALEIHAAYPGNKASLAGKTGPAPMAKTPEQLPGAAGRELKLATAATQGKGCFHCHSVQDLEFRSLRVAGQPIPDRQLWAYPMPDVLGLKFDPNERATLAAVAPGSAGEKAGFKSGDRVVSLEGQPLLSVADVQWVLHQAAEPSKLKAQIDRGGSKQDLTLSLEAGWRRAVPWLDAASVGWIIRQTVGGMRLEAVTPQDRSKNNLGADAPALKIRDLSPDFVKDRNASPKKAGLQKGDLIVAVDGAKVPATEQDYLLLLLAKKPGSKVELTVMRDGASRKAEIDVP